MLKGMQEWVYHAFPESSPGSHSFPGYLHETSPQFIAGIAPPPEAGLWRASSAAISLCCQRTQLCKWRTETLQSVKPERKFSLLESTSSVRSCDTVSLTLTGGRARITVDYVDAHVCRCHDGVIKNCNVWLVDSVPTWMGEGSHRWGLEEGLNGDWWRQRVRGLNLANGSAGVELILFALELSGLRIRELCLYVRHLLFIMMSHSRPYQVLWWGCESWQTDHRYEFCVRVHVCVFCHGISHKCA